MAVRSGSMIENWWGASTEGCADPSISGTWSTRYGDMVLIQSGSGVTGCYQRENSTIVGTMNGNVLEGTWTNTTGTVDSGPFKFTFSGGSFSGTWGYQLPLGTSINWTGTFVSDSTNASGICDLP